MNDPEYATPLGIAVSAGLGLISDSYRVRLNGQPAKLFRSGVLTALDVLQMNGYNYADLIGRTGASLSISIDGQRTLYRGEPAMPSTLRINGKELPPSTVIQAADSIEFTPACSGKPGRRTLAEVLGSEEAAAFCLVNGAPAAPDYELRSGDSIETNVIVPVRTPAAAAPKQDDAPATAEQNDLSAEPTPPPTRSSAPNFASAPAEESFPPCRFFLNGQSLELPAKPKGAPYYLMDLLDRTGLDFEHLDRPVMLKVNGENSAFMRVLKDGDNVSIQVEEPRT